MRTSAHQFAPEGSTAGIVVHPPQATYFAMGLTREEQLVGSDRTAGTRRPSRIGTGMIRVRNDPIYAEAMRFGREYRESLRPKDDPGVLTHGGSRRPDRP
jgi:hypothetical protein